MQSNRHSFFDSRDFIALAVAIIVAIAAAILAVVALEGSGALLLETMAGMVLGFTRPRGAWRWAVALASWVPVVAVLQLHVPTANAAQVWCGTRGHPVAAATVALMLFVACFVAVYLGVAIDWLVSTALGMLAATGLRWLHVVRPVLRGASIALGLSIILYAALSLAQPLQPYGLHERYCWDEFCFSVQSVSRVKTLRYGKRQATAHGVFYVVTAKMESPWWGRFMWTPDAVYVTDYDGTDYRYAPEGQRVADLIAHEKPGCREIPGASETEVVVFDLPADVVQPRLLVRDTLGINGLLGGWRDALFYIKPAFNLRYD